MSALDIEKEQFVKNINKFFSDFSKIKKFDNLKGASVYSAEAYTLNQQLRE